MRKSVSMSVCVYAKWTANIQKKYSICWHNCLSRVKKGQRIMNQSNESHSKCYCCRCCSCHTPYYGFVDESSDFFSICPLPFPLQREEDTWDDLTVTASSHKRFWQSRCPFDGNRFWARYLLSHSTIIFIFIKWEWSYDNNFCFEASNSILLEKLWLHWLQCSSRLIFSFLEGFTAHASHNNASHAFHLYD